MGAAKSRIRAFPKFFQKADLPYEVILDYWVSFVLDFLILIW
jgi:hypothetical protein